MATDDESRADGGRRPVVLHVLEALETGCARHLVDVVEHVADVRHEVAVPSERVGGTTDHRAVDRIRAAGGQVHVIEMRRVPFHWRNASALAQLLRLIRALRPDIVHGHSSVGGALARVAASAAPAVGVGSPVRFYTPNGLAAGRVASALERLLGRLTDTFVAVSVSERDEAMRRRLVPFDRIVVIPNGIVADRPAPADLRALAGIPPGVPIVGSMGRLSPQKAPEVLVAAFALIAAADPAPHFVLIGDGPLAGEVEATVDRLELRTRFHRLPAVPDAASYLHGLTVFTLTSRFEGGPYAPLEAMRAGVPVVLTDVVGNRDTVVDGVSGRLVAPESPDATAAAVLELLGNEDVRRKLAEGGEAALRDRFDVRLAASELRTLYEAAAPGAAAATRRA